MRVKIFSGGLNTNRPTEKIDPTGDIIESFSRSIERRRMKGKYNVSTVNTVTEAQIRFSVPSVKYGVSALMFTVTNLLLSFADLICSDRVNISVLFLRYKFTRKSTQNRMRFRVDLRFDLHFRAIFRDNKSTRKRKTSSKESDDVYRVNSSGG